jgi:hypothetical protein
LATRHVRRGPWRRPEQRFEGVEELRRRGNRTEHSSSRDRRGDEAGDAEQSGHQATSLLLGYGPEASPVNTENTAARGPRAADLSLG